MIKNFSIKNPLVKIIDQFLINVIFSEEDYIQYNYVLTFTTFGILAFNCKITKKLHDKLRHMLACFKTLPYMYV